MPQGAHPEKPHRLCRAGLATTQELGLPERKNRLSDQARHALAVHDRAVENPISQHGSCVSPEQEFPHLKKRYWGRHIWARGYFCATVGQVTDQMIRDCIEGHVGKFPDDSFTVDED